MKIDEMWGLPIAIAIAVIMSACTDSTARKTHKELVCGSDHIMIVKDTYGNTSAINDVVQTCTINEDGSFTVRKPDEDR